MASNLIKVNLMCVILALIDIEEEQSSFVKIILVISLILQIIQVVLATYFWLEQHHQHKKQIKISNCLKQFQDTLVLVNTCLTYPLYVRIRVINYLKLRKIASSLSNIVFTSIYVEIIQNELPDGYQQTQIFANLTMILPLLWVFFQEGLDDSIYQFILQYGCYFFILMIGILEQNWDGTQKLIKAQKIISQLQNEANENHSAVQELVVTIKEEDYQSNNNEKENQKNLKYPIENENENLNCSEELIKSFQKNQMIELPEQYKIVKTDRIQESYEKDLEEIHTLIHDGAKLGVIVYEDQGRLIYRNNRVMKILRCSQDQILAKIEETCLQIHSVNSQDSNYQGGSDNVSQNATSILNFKAKLEEQVNRQNSKNNFNENFEISMDESRFDQIGEAQFNRDELQDEHIQDDYSKKSDDSQSKQDSNLMKIIHILQIALDIEETSSEKPFERSLSDKTFLSIMRRNKKSQQGLKNNDKYKEEVKLKIKINHVSYKLKILVTKGSLSQQLLVFIFENEKHSYERRQKIHLISHQIRSPLNCSIGLLKIMMKTKMDPEIQRKFVSPCLTSNYYLLNNANMIIDLLEMEISEFKYEICKFSLNELFEEVIGIFQEQTQLKCIKVDLKMDQNVGYIWSDSKRIKQVLINLLSNCIKFSHTHGKINIEIYRDQIESMYSYQEKSGQIGNSQLNLNDCQIGEPQNDSNPPKIPKIVQTSPKSDIQVKIQDFGVGINNDTIDQILNKSWFGETEGQANDLRSQGFGLKSAIKVLEGLRDRSSRALPLQITSEIGIGCCYQFQLMDFRSELDEFEDVQTPNSKFSNENRWVDLNTNNNTLYLGKESMLPSENKETKIKLWQERDQYTRGISAEQENVPIEEKKREIECTPKESINMKSKMVFSIMDYNKNQNQLQSFSDISNLCESIQDFQIDSKRVYFNDILIVDDNEFNILTLEYIFEELSVQVDQAFNGQEAIQIFIDQHEESKSPYKLIIMDIDMPVKNGFQASREIVEFCHQNKIETNIVACTAFFGPEDFEKAQHIGMKDYVSKPVTLEIIAEILQKYSKTPSK